MAFNLNNRRRTRPHNNYNGELGYFRTRWECLIGRSPAQKNILSTTLGTAAIVMLCASLVEPKWFKLSGGKCCLEYAGPSIFISCISKDCWNIENALWNNQECIDRGYTDSTLDKCITSKTLLLMQVLIIFCFTAIVTCILSFILDILAPMKKPLWRALKRYAFGYVFAVLFCTTIIGFAYWISEDIYIVLINNRKTSGNKVVVSFDLGLYLVTTAGVLGILATASNLWRIYPSEEEEQHQQLLEEMEDLDDDDLTSDGNPPPYNPTPM